MDNQTNQNRKAIIYCRVSSERQKNEGHGLDSQEHRCRQYAKSKGYEVIQVFKDSFTGGGDFRNRPGMSSLLDYADKNAHRDYVVIFDDLKRLARDTIFYLKLRQEFNARNIKMESPNFTFEESDEAMFVETVLAAGAELERKQNRKQVIQKQKARLESGYWPFFPPPGYDQVSDRMHGKILKPNAKAQIIAESLEGFASGRFREHTDVQKFLQQNNFLRDKPVHLSYIRRLLKRIIYAGYIEYPDWEVERRKGHHEAIISLEVFEKVQSRMCKTTFKVNKRNEDFPLRGLLLCANCGRKMTAGWSRGRSKLFPYYKCQRIYCESKDVRKERIEGLFFELLKKLRPKTGIIKLAKKIIAKVWDKKLKNFGNVIDGYKTKRESLVRNRDQLLDKIGIVSREDVIRRLEEKISDTDKEISEIDGLIENSKEVSVNYGTVAEFVLGLLENPAFVWEKGDYNKKQLIAKLVFVENPIYDRELGYGTANLSAGIKLFEQISDFQYQDVEKGALKPHANKF